MLAILISAALATAAPEARLHAEWSNCVATKSDNYGYGVCSGTYMNAAEAQLNAAWKRLMSAVTRDPQTKAAMLTEQRAWLSYRNTACAFYGVQTDWGRTGEVLDGPECKAVVTERRTAELASYLKYVGPNGQGSR